MTDIRLRPLAEANLVERSEYYRSEGGDSLGERFFDAAIEALRDIERMPGAGSLRIGEMAGIDGLRPRRLERFPCGWHCFERNDCVDVVRILAYARDWSWPGLVDTGSAPDRCRWRVAVLGASQDQEHPFGVLDAAVAGPSGSATAEQGFASVPGNLLGGCQMASFHVRM